MGKVDEGPGENIMDGDRSVNNKNGLTSYWRGMRNKSTML
jgi:hypothetical protein